MKHGESIFRVATITQFKNKLKAVATTFKAKCSSLLATRNRASERQYPELPEDFFAVHDENTATATPDPAFIAHQYVSLLDNEVAALRSLLCDCFFGRPGCTG